MSIDNNVFDYRTQLSKNGTKKLTTTNGSETFGAASNDHSALGVFRQLSDDLSQSNGMLGSGVNLNNRGISVYNEANLNENATNELDNYDKLPPDVGSPFEIFPDNLSCLDDVLFIDSPYFWNPLTESEGDVEDEISANAGDNNSIANLENSDISLQTNGASQEDCHPDLKAAVEKFRKEKPTYTVMDFVKTLSPSDAGKAVMDKLFNALSAAGQKQIIWNSDITSADKFINAYMKKINDTLGFSIYSGLGPDLEKLFKVIPAAALNFSSPEDAKDKIENLFQSLNIGSDFSGEKRTRALRVAELIFILTNLSRDKVSIKNIDLKLVAQALNTHIFVKEEGMEEYRLFNKNANVGNVPIFLRQKISENYFRIVCPGGHNVNKENFDRFFQALFLTRNSTTGELTPWSGEDRKAWLENTHIRAKMPSK